MIEFVDVYRESIIYTLMGLIVLCACFQRVEEDLYASVIYSMSLVIHSAIALYEPTGLYYFTAMITSLAVIFMLEKFVSPTPLIESLQKVCLVSIMLNMFGWFLYMLLFPPIYYSISFMVLYSWAILILIKGSRDGVAGNMDGNIDVGRRNIRILADLYTGMEPVRKDTKAQ